MEERPGTEGNKQRTARRLLSKRPQCAPNRMTRIQVAGNGTRISRTNSLPSKAGGGLASVASQGGAGVYDISEAAPFVEAVADRRGNRSSGDSVSFLCDGFTMDLRASPGCADPSQLSRRAPAKLSLCFTRSQQAHRTTQPVGRQNQPRWRG